MREFKDGDIVVITTYAQFEEDLKKLEKQKMKPKFKKGFIEVTTIGDDKKQFIKVEKQKDPIEKKDKEI